jgi:hypothetical protein
VKDCIGRIFQVGDGVYKSTDAGKTWTHLGLRDGQQIPQLAVDPKNPDRVFVAVAGHPYGPNEERGIYRSIDGGKTFEKVLYRDENVGASDVQIDPSNPQIVYAALWESREGPWENGVFNGNGGGIFKSVDGGKTWRQLTKGLPDNIVQANLAIAQSAPKTLFAAVKTKTIAKLYRSDDGGETWHGTTDDPRPGLGIGGGDLPVVRFDPKKSADRLLGQHRLLEIDGRRKTWDGWRGAPGGTITKTFGSIRITRHHSAGRGPGRDRHGKRRKSWSSWYNQPTRSCITSARTTVSVSGFTAVNRKAVRSESKAAATTARFTFRDWRPVRARNMVTSLPIRSIQTSSSAAN